MSSVLIIGGRGRIGGSVARDILNYTDAHVTITGRQAPDSPCSWDISPFSSRLTVARLDVDALGGEHDVALESAIAPHDLVIHCAGPFHYREARVLQQCIAQGVNYLDVSDCVPFTRKALAYDEFAKEAGITAIINTGVFPGVSNSMARLCVEGFEQQTGHQADTIRLYYAVAGSGGAGVTVMRTTFLGLQHPFQALINGQWQEKLPYSDRQLIPFPKPYGKIGVYWYEVPETLTLAQSFPVRTVITKFGSLPDIYNHLTWLVAHWFPKSWVRNPVNIEAISQVSYRMTQVSDRFSGTGIAMKVDVTGADSTSSNRGYSATMAHEDTAIAAGAGTGGLAQLILANQLHKPGVNPVEVALPTALFQEFMKQRQVSIQVSQGVPSK